MKRLDGVKKRLKLTEVMKNGVGYEGRIMLQEKQTLRPTSPVISKADYRKHVIYKTAGTTVQVK